MYRPSPLPSPRSGPALRLAALAILTMLAILAPAAPARAAQPEPDLRRLEEYKTFNRFPRAATWKTAAPEVRGVTIRSTVDRARQPALFYDSGSDRDRPLLVVLHSWSTDYIQRQSIPLALWAIRNDWVFIHPNFRGINAKPEATGSELAVRDILDAVEYAGTHARVDRKRVYLAGFSGGGMAALLMAGRYPELWAGAAAFCPVVDLNDWYAHVARHPEKHYAQQIAASCGGPPLPGSPAAAECGRRSPGTYLGRARGKPLRILIAQGIKDDVVPPGQAVRAFNVLAAPADRIAPDDIDRIDARHALPSGLRGAYPDPAYDDAGKPLVFARTSGNATLQLFRGGHDIVFGALFDWLGRAE